MNKLHVITLIAFLLSFQMGISHVYAQNPAQKLNPEFYIHSKLGEQRYNYYYPQAERNFLLQLKWEF